jgi:hypothetical protein
MLVERVSEGAARDNVLRGGFALIESNKVIHRGWARDQKTGGVVEEVVRMSDVMGRLPEKMDPFVKASTAIMMDNTRKWLYDEINETTRLMNVGDFEKYAFQMVRAVFPNLIAHQIVSVQPMMGPTSLIFYMQYLYSQSKGSAVAGTDMLENPNPAYSSEHIDTETVGASASTLYTGTLSYQPIRPGTVVITDGTLVITDNGSGSLIGDTGVGTNTINYATGAYNVTFSASTVATVTAGYDYNMEANENIPEIDLNLVSSPVLARPRKLRTKWSLESVHDLKSLHGLEAEVELVGATANELKFEIDREIINDLISIASATSQPIQWSSAAISSISYTEQKLSFIDTLTWASNAIYKKTQRAVGTWIVGGIGIMNLIETLPGFKGDGVITGRGVYRVGTLNNKWVVYKDSYLPDNNFIMGYKGEAMFETGYVWAPYIPMYTTPTVMLDDFVGRRGIASRYGKKAVNSKFFCNGQIITTGSGGPLAPVY